MLRHFFQMFVDENTSLLDPTAGSGSALRAAESLGAKRVLGLEVDQEYAKNANVAMRNFRNLRKVSK
jgi:tRNA G10  N-methylase Trm11